MKAIAVIVLAVGLASALSIGAGARAEEPLAGDSAEVFSRPDAWADYPVREVERPALPPKGGAVISAAFSSIAAETMFDDDGDLEDLDDPYRLLVCSFGVGYGITRWWEVSAGFPYLTGESNGVSGGGGGDLWAGSRVALFSNPNLDISLGLAVSFPTGDSAFHYETIDGRLVQQNFRTGDPGVNYYPRLETRLMSGPWSARLSVEGIFTGPGNVDFNFVGVGTSDLDILFDEGQQEVDPGNGYRVTEWVLYQITDHWVVGAVMGYENVSETTLSGHGLDDARSGLGFEPVVLCQPMPGLDIIFGVQWAGSGRNSPAGYYFDLGVTSRF